jgi:glycolate oxidase FAD binding subunit
MELIHPSTKGDVVDAIRDANGAGQRLLVVGGRQHMDKGNPSAVDGELWTTQLDRLVEHEPAEMIAVVEAGMRIGDLNRLLADAGQEWPSDAPEDSTVGGVIAAEVNSPRRLGVGRIGNTVLEVELVTGDGRFVRSGARTVKSVTGYAVHRLVTGSLGTLGVIVQAALRLRPLPAKRRTLSGPATPRTGQELLERLGSPAGVLTTPGNVEVHLEGWPEEVDELSSAAQEIAPELERLDDEPFPATRPWEGAPVIAEVAVRPSAVGEVTDAVSGPADAGGERWGALLGVGLLWVGLDADGTALSELRTRVAEIGGIAPVIRGPGGLGDAPLPAPHVHERIRRIFDPNGVLAPGRFWGGL